MESKPTTATAANDDSGFKPSSVFDKPAEEDKDNKFGGFGGGFGSGFGASFRGLDAQKEEAQSDAKHPKNINIKIESPLDLDASQSPGPSGFAHEFSQTSDGQQSQEQKAESKISHGFISPLAAALNIAQDDAVDRKAIDKVEENDDASSTNKTEDDPTQLKPRQFSDQFGADFDANFGNGQIEGFGADFEGFSGGDFTEGNAVVGGENDGAGAFGGAAGSPSGPGGFDGFGGGDGGPGGFDGFGDGNDAGDGGDGGPGGFDGFGGGGGSPGGFDGFGGGDGGPAGFDGFGGGDGGGDGGGPPTFSGFENIAGGGAPGFGGFGDGDGADGGAAPNFPGFGDDGADGGPGGFDGFGDLDVFGGGAGAKDHHIDDHQTHETEDIDNGNGSNSVGGFNNFGGFSNFQGFGDSSFGSHDNGNSKEEAYQDNQDTAPVGGSGFPDFGFRSKAKTNHDNLDFRSKITEAISSATIEEGAS